MDHEPITYSIPGTSQVTGLPRTTVYRLIAEGALDARKAGRRTLITSDSINAYLAGLPLLPSANQLPEKQ